MFLVAKQPQDGTRYLLQFLFDASQITISDLQTEASKIIGRHRPSVEMRVDESGSKSLCLVLTGSLNSVDACHSKIINSNLLKEYSAIRLADQAGAEIRNRAYPCLAEIEDSLRAFINKTMVDGVGYDWWDRVTPTLVRNRVEEVARKLDSSACIHHPLELSEFGHLLDILTGSHTEWTADRPLTVSDIRELLTKCKTLESMQAELIEKTTKLCLWDDIFSRYFVDQEQVNALLTVLREKVIPIRNKVMHHRPMSLHDLNEIQAVRGQIQRILDNTREQLSAEERSAVDDTGAKLTRAIQNLKELHTQELQRLLDMPRSEATELLLRLVANTQRKPLQGALTVSLAKAYLNALEEAPATEGL